MNNEKKLFIIYILCLAIILLSLKFIFVDMKDIEKKISYEQEFIVLEAVNNPLAVSSKTYGVISAYNSLQAQTDDTPCIAAGGYICGREDVVANNCLKLGTWIEINGKMYQVMDRMNKRYGCDYYDIFMDQDLKGAKNFGRQKLEIIIY